MTKKIKKPVVSKKNPPVQEKLKDPICPHCSKAITNVDWRNFANGQITLVCHTSCMKVIGVK